ncbi:MAG TPA: polysaccharide pyruvyl transferase family protein [Gemmatimonadales bacterium]|nr:polysaccharide pyruvyl transferase family protein [Gemmatimonadales bacterium]
MATTPRVTILGSFSGRNAGDMAILGNMLAELAHAFPTAVFRVPTTNPRHLARTFGRYRLEPIGLRPWDGSIKILGLPILRAMLATDVVLVTDNILFDRQYFNPLFNHLATISLVAPLCRRRGIPLVIYGGGLGPIRTRRGARALRRVLDACRLLLLRDLYSVDLLARLGLRHPRIALTADPALNTAPPPPEHTDRLLRRLGVGEGPLLSFNVNSYLDAWERRGPRFDRDRFAGIVAAALDRAVDSLGVQLVLVATQAMDRSITEEVRRAMQRRDRVRVYAEPRPDYREIAGLLRRAELHVGMRTHSLILAAAAGTPVAGLIAYPKSHAFLEMLGLEEWSLGFEALTVEALDRMIQGAWAARAATRVTLTAEVRKLQVRARRAPELVGRLLGLEPAAPPLRAAAAVPTPSAGAGPSGAPPS